MTNKWKTSNFRHSLLWRQASYLVLLAIGILLHACSLMDEDHSECPMGLYVTFVYDYNGDRADMLKDQVGGITAYVIDQNGKVVAEQTVENTPADAPLRTFGYQMNFPGLRPGKYRVVALAGQQSLRTMLGTPGAKFRIPDRFGVGSNISDLRVRLDRNPADTTITYEEFVDRTKTEPRTLTAHRIPGSQPLDTLWHTINYDAKKHPLAESTDALPVYEVRFQKPTYATVPLVRNTKQLNLIVTDYLQTTDEEAPQYDVFIAADNGEFCELNTPIPGDRLLYLPYNQWQQEAPLGGNGSTFERIVETHVELSFPRLVIHDRTELNATLYVVDRKTRKAVIQVDLPTLLANYRSDLERARYSNQEFLDRESKFNIQFAIVNQTWQYANISVRILKWKRNNPQYVDL